MDFVASHLQLKNTLDRARSEMDAAAKAAQAEARAKSKVSTTKTATRTDPKPAETSKPAPQTVPEPPRTTSLFDASAEPAAAEVYEEDEILAEASGQGDNEDAEEELDEAA